MPFGSKKICYIFAVAFALSAAPMNVAQATTFFETTRKCPMGGEKFKSLEIGSYTSWGQRPDGRSYGTLPIFPLPVCPKNGFVIFDENFTKEELAKLNEAVASGEYQALVKSNEAPFYRAWWLATKINRPLRERAGLLMQAGWGVDENPERKRQIQREFADLTEQFDLDDKEGDGFWLSLRGANALREIGDFQNATIRLEKLKAAKTYPVESDAKEGADFLIAGLSRLVEDRNSESEPTNLIPKNAAKDRCANQSLLNGVELEACQANAKPQTDDDQQEDSGDAATAAKQAALAGAAQSCPTEPVLSDEWQGWKQITSIKTMAKYRPNMVDQWLPIRNIRTGMALHSIANVEYWVAPGKQVEAGKYGGLNNINVAKAGRLKIALNEGAWIDLVKDGVAIPSTAHSHGADCSGIRKIVEFDVTPGTYIVQIVNAPHSSMSAMAILAD